MNNNEIKPAPSRKGWPDSIWSRAKIMQFARCFAKGDDTTQMLVDVSQEACRLFEDAEKFKQQRDQLIKVIEEVNYEVSNYETLIDGQYLKELIDNPSIQKIMKEIT